MESVPLICSGTLRAIDQPSLGRVAQMDGSLVAMSSEWRRLLSTENG